MRLWCDRPGCSGTATVAFSFDGAERVVRLTDAPGEAGQRAGLLCERHANRFTPPVGWHVRSDRGGATRPAPEPAGSVEPSVAVDVEPAGEARPQSGSLRPARRKAKVATGQTALDIGEAAVGARPIGHGESPGTTRPDADDTGPDTDDVSDEFDLLLDADSPLLSRAFRTAHPDAG